jgi:hypothetical protein
MNETWKTYGEACIDFALALQDVENHLKKIGGSLGTIEVITTRPDDSIGAKITLEFSGPELREYISQLPQRVSDTSQG